MFKCRGLSCSFTAENLVDVKCHQRDCESFRDRLNKKHVRHMPPSTKRHSGDRKVRTCDMNHETQQRVQDLIFNVVMIAEGTNYSGYESDCYEAWSESQTHLYKIRMICPTNSDIQALKTTTYNAIRPVIERDYHQFVSIPRIKDVVSYLSDSSPIPTTKSQSYNILANFMNPKISCTWVEKTPFPRQARIVYDD